MNVGHAAGAERHDDGDPLGREILRRGRRGAAKVAAARAPRRQARMREV